MHNEERLSGTVSLVIGASSGIGKATARELARLGSKVVLAARRTEKLQAIVKEIKDLGGEATACTADAAVLEDIKRMVAFAEETYGRLDFAVNTAGGGSPGPFLQYSPEVLDEMLELNLRGLFLAMQAQVAAMLRAGGGSIVNVSSVAGALGLPWTSLYSTVKYGMQGLTKSVAAEYATQNIRVNAILPGLTDTELVERNGPQVREGFLKATLMGRAAEPIEIARSIVYLLADATFTTGSLLIADGGLSLP